MTWRRIAAIERRLAREQGTIRKDWGGRLPIALVFPNRYYLGMSSLAVQTLYHLWNARDDVACERVFAEPLPPLSLESGAPLDYFPIVAFSLAYEMDYFNLVRLLRAAGIPPRSADRDERHPLLIAGGPAVSANPEPLAPLLDAILIGEIEPVFDSLTEALHQVSEGRDAALTALSQIPGLYLPPLAIHNSQFTIRNSPIYQSTNLPISQSTTPDLDAFPTHTVILTPDTEFAGRGLIEIGRGCGRGCRFCLAGYIYRPPRWRSAENILAQARDLLRRTDRLGLVSAAVSDHPAIDRLAVELRAMGARLSVSSMRVDPLSEPLVRALAESGVRTLTIAPEAGSERLRRAINKTQTEDDVLRAVEMAARYGFAQVKLYFMLGLPGEEEADVEALAALALACADRFPRQVTVNITPFVPKAHTPFQRIAQTPAKVVKGRLARVERALRRRGIAVKGESPAWAEVQGALARGDRRLAEALLAVDEPTPGRWRRALAEAGLSAAELRGPRPDDAPLPWDFIRSGLRPAYLEREARRAESLRTTPACPPRGCTACGVCDGPGSNALPTNRR